MEPTPSALTDEADRPTAPAVPGLELSPRGLAVSRHLVDVHDHLRSELAQVRDLAAQVLDGDLAPGAARSALNDMTLRQNDWVLGAYCATYCRTLTAHHTLESQAMFPHLRAQDRTLAEVLDRLESEHVAIHHVLEDVDRALVAFVSGPQGRAGLRAAVEVMSATLLSHLAYEERELHVPLARFGMAPGQV